MKLLARIIDILQWVNQIHNMYKNIYKFDNLQRGNVRIK